MPDAPPPLPKSQPFFSRRSSTMFKLLGVGALILLMLIPLLMIEGVVVLALVMYVTRKVDWYAHDVG